MKTLTLKNKTLNRSPDDDAMTLNTLDWLVDNMWVIWRHTCGFWASSQTHLLLCAAPGKTKENEPRYQEENCWSSQRWFITGYSIQVPERSAAPKLYTSINIMGMSCRHTAKEGGNFLFWFFISRFCLFRCWLNRKYILISLWTASNLFGPVFDFLYTRTWIFYDPDTAFKRKTKEALLWPLRSIKSHTGSWPSGILIDCDSVDLKRASNTKVLLLQKLKKYDQCMHVISYFPTQNVVTYCSVQYLWRKMWSDDDDARDLWTHV